MIDSVYSELRCELIKTRELVTADLDVALLLEGNHIVKLTRLDVVLILRGDTIEIEVKRLSGRESELPSLSCIDALSVLKDDMLSAIDVVLL